MQIYGFQWYAFAIFLYRNSENILYHNGKYALGLKKEWGINNKISPLLYFHKKANTYRSIKTLYSVIKTITTSEVQNIVDPKGGYFGAIFYLLKYIKPYKGSVWKNNKIIKKMLHFTMNANGVLFHQKMFLLKKMNSNQCY